MQPRRVPHFLGAAGSAWACVVLLGCVSPVLTDPASGMRPVEPKRQLGEFTFFEHPSGSGAVSIRVVDERPRRIQDLADADPSYNGVLFRLSNPNRLKSNRVLALPANGSDYAAVFTNVPSDSGTNYFLTVGLYRNIQSPGLATDPGYANPSNKAGEGGSERFLVTPGQTTTVTVRINAVGNLVLDSMSTLIDPANPVLLAGEPTAWINTNVNALKSPLAQVLNMYVLDNAGTATISTRTLAKETWPASPLTATLSLPVPGQSGNYRLCLEEASGSEVLSRRYKLFSVEAPATISVSLE